MGGETEKEISGWTTDTLKGYVDQRFRDQEKAVDAALAAAEKAVATANSANDKRFESVNEFRGQLGDQVTTFMPRKEYDARHETLETRVAELTDRMNRTEGRGIGLNAGWLYLLGGIAAVGTVISLYLATS